VCPVGTILGFLARFSLLKLRIDKDKCTSCNICAKNCKASCIDINEKKMDYSRCVSCFNCMAVCPREAISYTLPTKANAGARHLPSLSYTGQARRNIISASTLAVLGSASLLHAHRPADGGLAFLADKKAPKRETPIVPPGSLAVRYLQRHCSACLLCVSVCPNHVLRPSREMSSFMKPLMSFERGYCRPECVKCSEVCPTGAITKITREQKSSIQIGVANWREELCIINTDKVSCNNCERQCPAKAIKMIPKSSDDPKAPLIPMIETDRCIGCGACEHLCPARPESAIYVEGIEVHREV
jgi:Pyruvate/2-oxoacid:ferredoxin oxidoreductase delta subunit